MEHDRGKEVFRVWAKDGQDVDNAMRYENRSKGEIR